MQSLENVIHGLTPQTFAEAMTLCSENSYYKAYIVFADRESMVEFITELKNIGSIPNVRRAITRRTDYGRLEFFNGSVIEIMLGTEQNIRGKRSLRCNKLIISGAFENGFYEYIGSMVSPYRATVTMEEQFFDTALFSMRSKQQTIWASSNNDLFAESTDELSEELDAFLDSFTINQNVNKTAL